MEQKLLLLQTSICLLLQISVCLLENVANKSCNSVTTLCLP